MGESLTQRRRVGDEGLRIVNPFSGGKMERAIVRTVPPEAATANFVPAAAVIRRWQALFGFTGRTGCVGGLVSLLLKLRAQPGKRRGYCQARGWERSAEFPV